MFPFQVPHSNDVCLAIVILLSARSSLPSNKFIATRTIATFQLTNSAFIQYAYIIISYGVLCASAASFGQATLGALPYGTSWYRTHRLPEWLIVRLGK